MDCSKLKNVFCFNSKPDWKLQLNVSTLSNTLAFKQFDFVKQIKEGYD